MIELLQENIKKAIVICNQENFYIARGKDAVLFHEIANLKLNCLERKVYKET